MRMREWRSRTSNQLGRRGRGVKRWECWCISGLLLDVGLRTSSKEGIDGGVRHEGIIPISGYVRPVVPMVKLMVHAALKLEMQRSEYGP